MHEFEKEHSSSIAVTGRHQIIRRDPGKEFERPILAAGAVLWRGTLPNPEIAIIHRPHYDDWTLPKGKVDDGESLPVAAVRELKEETGFTAKLGKLLGLIHYPLNNGTKVVYYWTAEAIGGAFIANKEVDELVWLPLNQAIAKLSYPDDRSLVEKATKRFASHAETQVLYVRAAKNNEHIELLAPLLEAFQPTSIIAADTEACVDTAKPLAQTLGIPLEIDHLFSEAGWLDSMKQAQTKWGELTHKPTTIVVSEKRAIQDTLAWLALQGTLPLEDLPAKKSSVWVLGFRYGELIGADYLESPKPVV